MFKIYLLDSRNYPAVLYDDLHIFEPAVLEPELEMNGDNGILIGKLAFKLHDPSLSSQLRLLQNTVIVTQMIGGVETVIFRGRPLLRDDDDYNDQDYTFEGILAGLNDTLQTPSTDKGIGFTSHLAIILNRHNYLASSYSYGNKNRMVDYSKIDRHFESSYMHTIEGDPFSESLAYKANIDPVALDYVRTRASTMDHLKTQFIDSWGGYFYLENEPLTYDSDGCIVLHNYLNYVDIYSPDQVHINAQRIEFGKNLISIRRSVSADDFATVLIPLGKQLTDIEKAWPYYQSVENNKVRKIVSSPDDAVLENYNSTNAYINSETAAVTTGGGSSYVILNDVEVEPGDVFYLTTYLEGFSTDISAASYAILSRDATKVFSIGSSVRNSKDSGGTVTVKNLVLKDERIEIPAPEDTSVLLKLRTAYMISANDPNGGFVLKKFNPQYQEDNVTIMSVSPVATGTIRKRGQFDVGRDVFPDATEDAEAPETYEQSKRVYNNDLYEIFGSIEKVIEFSDYGIDHLSTIYSKAAMMLEKMGEDLEIEIQAADLSYIDESQEPFQPYDLVPVYSEPHGIDMMLPIVKMTLPLADPAAATYTLQNDIHLSEDSKKYISQMVSSPGANAQKNQTVVIYNGGGSGGGSGEQGPPGPAGADGADGYSPTVAVSAITGGHTVTITDTNGDHSFNVMDGEDGQDGADGVSPTVTVTPITGGNRITITDRDHPGGISFNVMDGEDGDSSDLKHTVTIQKYNGSWRLLSDDVTMTWADLWNEQTDDITLIAVDGTEVRHLHKTSVEFTSGSTIDSVDIYFSNQRYNGRTAEGKVFKLTVPSDGSTGTITEITGADIPTSGGGGSAVYEIPITATSYSWSTDKQGDEIYANADNCVLVVNGTYLAVLSSEKYTENGSQYVRIVGVEYDVLNSNDYEFYAYEVIAENSNAGSPIVTRRHYDSDFFIRHHVFFYNENTHAITNTAGVAATGSDIDNILTAGFSSVYIIGELMENGDMTYYFYTPMTDESVGSNTGSVKFSRTTDTGVEILTIPANSSTATKTTSSLSGAVSYSTVQTLTETQKRIARTNIGISGTFDVLFGVSNGTNIIISNIYNTTVTGQDIKDRITISDRNCGCILILRDESDSNHYVVYDLDEYAENGPVSFYRISDGYRYTIVVPLLSYLATKYSDPLSSVSGFVSYADTQSLTSSQMLKARNNIGMRGNIVPLYYENATESGSVGYLKPRNADKSYGSMLTGAGIREQYFYDDRSFVFVYDDASNIYTLKSLVSNTITFHRIDGNTEELITISGMSYTAEKSSVSIGGSISGAVLYDSAQNLTDAQKVQAKTNIGAIPQIVSLSYDSQTETWSCNRDAAWLLDNCLNSFLYYNGDRYFVTSFVWWGGTTKTIYYQKQELDSNNPDIDEFKFAIQDSTVTITRSQYTHDTSGGAFEIPVNASTSGGVTTYSTTATFAEIMAHKPNLIVRYGNLYYTLSYSASSDPDSWYRFVFSAEQPGQNGVLETEWLIVECENNAVTITADSLDIDNSANVNVFYYVDGTNIKGAADNTVKTGRQINDETIAIGLSPVIYEYDSNPVYANMQYHFYQFDSGDLVFRRLDGKADIRIAATSTTLVKTINGYNTPYNIVTYWNSSEQKYYIRRYDASGNYHSVGYKELDYYAEGLMLNESLPVSKIVRSYNWIGLYFHDIQVTNNSVTIVEWYIDAGTTNGVVVTRTVKRFQLAEYYTVTLNANGTVNTRSNDLDVVTVSARMSYPNCADYLLVTWGTSLFTAKAVEKLTNDDIKFICDVEHDGIQRHMVFTLDGDNILTTTAIETYSLRPVTVWEVQDAMQGLSALNTNITSTLEWQLTNLNLAPFKCIKIYSRAGRKTGALAADSSITPASIIEMSLDDRAKETVSQNVFIGSSVVQNPNDPNRLGILTCAVSADKTKFAVVRATTLYGTAATSNTDAYPRVFKIEGCYD